MIKFVSVSKLYKESAAVKDVTFDIEQGEFALLTGHSGSGKSTLVKMIIREILPTSGKVYVKGDDLTKMKRGHVSKLRQNIGVVFQDFRLLSEKNIYENIAFALEVSGKSDKEIKEIVSYVLEIVGLENKAYAFPHELSGGQQQKVTIARAIANDPEILIADEPTGNLDSDSTWEILNILQKINNWGTTIIMATHGQEIIENLDVRRLILEKGELISDSKNGNATSEEFENKVLVKTEKHLKKNKKNKKRDSVEHKAEEIKKEPKKDPKIKIGLSKNSKKAEKEIVAEQTSTDTKVEESATSAEVATKSNTFEDNAIPEAIIKILKDNGYSNMQDLLNIENIKDIPNLDEKQIQIINESLKNFN